MRGVWGRVHHIRWLTLGVSVFVVVAGFSVSTAASPNLSQSYSTDQSIPNGSLVSLNPKDKDTVVLANRDNAAHLLGVRVNGDDSLLAVGAADNKAQIATSGPAATLVSTLNGSIKVGDQITPSPYNGIGMKADPGLRIIGLAKTDLDTNSSTTSKEVTDKNGRDRTIEVGYIQVSVAVGASPAASPKSLNKLQKTAQSIIGRSVATWRLIASLTVLLVAFIVLVTLIYSSIYSGIVSIGRNPLAKYSVFRALGSVMAMTFGLALLAAIIIFLLVKG